MVLLGQDLMDIRLIAWHIVLISLGCTALYHVCKRKWLLVIVLFMSPMYFYKALMVLDWFIYSPSVLQVVYPVALGTEGDS